MFRRLLLLTVIIFAGLPAYASFTPAQPTIPTSELKPGMTGYMLTVLKGTKPSRIPVRVESVIPQKPGHNYRDLVLVRLLKGYKLAQGMSGSPVYVGGKLAGAIRSGWKDTDHTLAAVMPIEYMCRLHDVNNPPSTKLANLTAVNVSGMNIGPAMTELSRKLGVTFTQGVSSSGAMTTDKTPLKPGDSIAGLLVWGDVEVSAFGAVTATDNHGRFLAFGHDFMKRGNAAYPSAGVYVHDVLDSSSFPFKLASITSLNGTITQDRETGIAGRFGYYPAFIQVEFIFRDIDRDTEQKYRFRAVADEFMSAELIQGVCVGLAEDAWDRKGQGTMSVTVRIDGRNVLNGWTRKDIFYSDDNILGEAFKQAKSIITAYLTQPFTDTMPARFRITVEATQNPRVLLIDDVKVSEDAKPGDEIGVTVTLRGWRAEPITRNLTMKIPEDASGVVELIVRGGGTQSLSQAGIEGGWMTITSLERMLSEFRAVDANNQLILELNADRTGEFVRKVKNARKKGARTPPKKEREPDLLPEEEEYLSETKERRIKEGTLRIYSSDYYVDGLMRRVIHVER